MKDLDQLLAERKALEDRIANIENRRELEKKKMEETESEYEVKIARLELQLKEAETNNPSFTFPLSSARSLTMYAANTPSSKRRHGSHRRLHTSCHDCEEELVQTDGGDEEEQQNASTIPSISLPFPVSSKRGRPKDEDFEGGAAAKRSHIDEDIMEEKEMCDLLNTSVGEEDNLDIADEDITKLLDEEKDNSSSTVVMPVLDEVMEKVLKRVWGKDDSSLSQFSLSGKPKPFVRNTPSSMRRHGSHRRLHDSGLAESDGEFEEGAILEETDVFISYQDQSSDVGTRPLPFVQQRQRTASEHKVVLSPASLVPTSALASLSASSLRSKDELASPPIIKDSTCDLEKDNEEDVTYQAILALLRR